MTDELREAELLPCPFCGARNRGDILDIYPSSPSLGRIHHHRLLDAIIGLSDAMIADRKARLSAITIPTTQTAFADQRSGTAKKAVKLARGELA